MGSGSAKGLRKQKAADSLIVRVFKSLYMEEESRDRRLTFCALLGHANMNPSLVGKEGRKNGALDGGSWQVRTQLWR